MRGAPHAEADPSTNPPKSQKAKRAGISVERIIPFGADQGERPQKSPQKRLVKYVNPSDESETWTGRGHRPRWLKQNSRMVIGSRTSW
jgi:DNA-binding protein H-NS